MRVASAPTTITLNPPPSIHHAALPPALLCTAQKKQALRITALGDDYAGLFARDEALEEDPARAHAMAQRNSGW